LIEIVFDECDIMNTGSGWQYFRQHSALAISVGNSRVGSRCDSF